MVEHANRQRKREKAANDMVNPHLVTPQHKISWRNHPDVMMIFHTQVPGRGAGAAETGGRVLKGGTQESIQTGYFLFLFLFFLLRRDTIRMLGTHATGRSAPSPSHPKATWTERLRGGSAWIRYNARAME